jgi:hypothetical protein
MLDRARHDMARRATGLNSTDEREIVGLSAAGGEDDFFWFGTN